MTNAYPRLVYKDKGPYQRKGGSYSSLCVDNEIDERKARETGWHESLEAAIDFKESKHEEAKDETISNAPPSRAELELKARELKILFSSKTSDAALTGRIEKAMPKKENDVLV